MLYKAHSKEYLEDFGVRNNDKIELFEHGEVKFNYNDFSPVRYVNAFWMEKPIKVRMEIAATAEEKRKGLQGHKALAEHSGMYFPYPGGADVAFHQGSVPFSLDLIFLRGDEVIGRKENTKVGGVDRWTCPNCDGVMELNSGYCRNQDIRVGDRVCLWAISKRDEIEVRKEALTDLAEELGTL